MPRIPSIPSLQAPHAIPEVPLVPPVALVGAKKRGATLTGAGTLGSKWGTHELDRLFELTVREFMHAVMTSGPEDETQVTAATVADVLAPVVTMLTKSFVPPKDDFIAHARDIAAVRNGNAIDAATFHPFSSSARDSADATPISIPVYPLQDPGPKKEARAPKATKPPRKPKATKPPRKPKATKPRKPKATRAPRKPKTTKASRKSTKSTLVSPPDSDDDSHQVEWGANTDKLDDDELDSEGIDALFDPPVVPMDEDSKPIVAEPMEVDPPQLKSRAAEAAASSKKNGKEYEYEYEYE